MPGPGRHLGARRKVATRARRGQISGSSAAHQQRALRTRPSRSTPTRAPASHGPTHSTVTPTGGGVKAGSGVTRTGRKTRRADRKVARVTRRIGATPVSTTNLSQARSRLRDLRSAETAMERVTKAMHSKRSGGLSAPFSPDEAATLIKRRGGTTAEARALSTKIVGESGGNPKSVEPWESPGVHGLGLWQITTGVGNDDLIARHGGTKAMLKAGPNADAALEIYRSSGIGAWHAPSNAPGTPSKAPKRKPPKRKDLAKIAKVGIPVSSKGKVTPLKPKGSQKQPFRRASKKASRVRHPERIVNPKWDPDTDGHGLTQLAKGISPVVKKWAKKYDVTVGEAKADSGHVSPGHLVTGTATDVYPRENSEAGWDKLEKGLKVLVDEGFEVGYGTNGVGQAWANHGRYNHAHIEWVGQGSSEGAIAKLGHLSGGQISRMENSAGGGGGGSVASGGSMGAGGGSVASSGSLVGAKEKGGKETEKRLKKVKHFAGKTPVPDLTGEIKAARARRRKKSASSSEDPISAALRKKYGHPAV